LSGCISCPAQSVSASGAITCLPSSASCPLNTEPNSGACKDCPYGSKSPGRGALCKPCVLCIDNLAATDNRRLALAGVPSRVFLAKKEHEHPFSLRAGARYSGNVMVLVSSNVSNWLRLRFDGGTFGSSATFTGANFSAAVGALGSLVLMPQTFVSAMRPVSLTFSFQYNYCGDPYKACDSVAAPDTLLLQLLPDVPLWPAQFSPPVGSAVSAPLHADVYPGTATFSFTIGSSPPAVNVWPPAWSNLSWSTDTPAALSLVRVTIDSGCLPGDRLTVGPFLGAVPQPALQPACATGYVLRGTGNLYDFVTALEATTFSSNATSATARLLRVIKFEFVGLATLYSSVRVAPPAPTAKLKSPSLTLLEGSPPDFAVVVKRACSGGAVLGLPAFCFESSWLPFSRSEGSIDAYTGTSKGPLALTGASPSFAPSFSSFNSSACSGSWHACPVGPLVYDCSDAPPAPQGPTAPVSCLWRRYRAMLGVSACPPVMDADCGPACALDYEALYCATAAAVPVKRAPPVTFTASLQLNSTASNVTLTIGDISDEAPALAWVGAPPNASFPLHLDDSAPSSPAQLMYFCSQDGVPPADSVSFGPPLQGATALSAGGASTRSVLQVDPVSSSLEWLSRPTFAACNAQLLNSTPPPFGSSWANVTIFSLKAAAPGALRTVPARALSVTVYPYAGAPLAAALTLPILLTRANRPVAWVGIGNASLALSENSPPGFNAALTLLVADDDAEQDVAFLITSVVLQSCDGGAPPAAPFPVPPSLFALAPIPNLTTVTDFATGAVRRDVPSTRRVAVAVGADALDIDEPAAAWGVPATAACTFRLTILARDNGDPTPSQSLLPLQDPTIATATVDVRVTRDAANTVPNVTAFERVPPAGLSADGGDMVELVGSGLGLPAGPTANVSGALLGATGATFPLVNCTVIARLTRVRCFTTPGFGGLSGGAIAVGCQRANFSVPTLPAYVRPQAVAVADAGSGGAQWHGTVGDFAAAGATNVSILVVGIPSAVSLAALGRAASLWAALLLQGDAFLPLGGCSPSAGGAPRANLAAGRNLFSNTTFALAAAQRHAAWFDCPLPSVSGGFFQQVVVHADFPPAPAAGAAPGFSPYFGAEEEPFFVTAAGGEGRPLQLPPQLLAAAWDRSAPPRAAPAISSVLQAAPGLAFTVTGSALGDTPLAWQSDRIEYARVEADGRATPDCASPAAAAALLASCAVHAAVGCVYVTPHTAVACALEAGGWGGGFRVRAVVGGQASAWSADANLSYAAPLLSRLSVVGLIGRSETESGALLEPSGGGLLTLHGANLGPPQALVITVGGVRVFPVQARPLPLSPPNRECSSSARCFGNASFSWVYGNATSSSVPGNVTVTYPPGVGTVWVEVWLGSQSAGLNVTYFPPLLLGIASATKLDATWDVVLLAARLPPCAAICVVYSSCKFLRGDKQSSSFFANSALAATSDLRQDPTEGPLPSPLMNVSLGQCALPSNGWEWLAGAELPLSAPTLRTRSLLWPSPDAKVSGDFDGFNGTPPLLRISAATFEPFVGSDRIELLGFPDAGGAVTLRYVWNGEDITPPATFNLTEKGLNAALSLPQVVRLDTPPTWRAEPHGFVASLEVKNTGPFGAVLIFPSAPAGSERNWSGGPIPCALIGPRSDGRGPPASTILLTDQEGNTELFTDTDTALAEVFGSKWVRRDASTPGTPFLNPFVPQGDAPHWEYLEDENATLPCWIHQWAGARALSGVYLGQQHVSFFQPAWAGGATMEVELFAMGKVSSSSGAATVTIEAPQIDSVFPSSGIHPSGGNVTLTGANFGRASSLGSLWVATGARAVVRKLATLHSTRLFPGWSEPVAEAAHPQRVFFSYNFPAAPSRGPGGVALRRYCGDVADPLASPPQWTDEAITCWAPEGVAGSLNYPIFQVDAAAYTTIGNDPLKLFIGSPDMTYATPNIAEVKWDPLSEPPLFTLYGNFSRFAQVPGKVDPAEGLWNYTVVVQGVSGKGLVNGINSQQGRFVVTSSPITTMWFTQANVTLRGLPGTRTLPPLLPDKSVDLQLPARSSPFVPQLLEGRVEFFIELKSTWGETTASAAPAILDVGATWPPRLLSVLAVPVNASTDGDAADPCAPNATLLCTDKPWLNPFFPAPARGSHCFRAVPSPITGVKSRLRITGSFFGSFAAGATAGQLLYTLSPLNFKELSAAPVKCSSRDTVLLSKWAQATNGESTIFCDIEGNLARGPIVLNMTLAFSSVTATSAGGLVPLGACPCGFYSEVDGRACAPCPPNGFCQGGLEPPRARKDFWETNLLDWRGRGFSYVAVLPDGSEAFVSSLPGDGANVTRFVKCPIEGTCLPAQQCAEGSTGFMCTMCAERPLLYRRGAAGACERCSRELSQLLVSCLALLPLLLLTVVAARWLCLNWVPCMRNWDRVTKHCIAGAARARACATLSCCGGPVAAPEVAAYQQDLLPLLKIAVTFAQTVGALASFVSTNAPGRKPDPNDSLLVPKFVRALSFFTNFGVNLSQFRCAAEVDYRIRVALLVALPAICVSAVPLAWWVLRWALNALRDASFLWSSRNCKLRKDAAPPGRFVLPLAASAVSALYLLLPVTITSLAHAQECGRDELGAYLVEDPSVACKLEVSTTSMARTAARVYVALPVAIGVWSWWLLPGYTRLDTLLEFAQRGYHKMSFPALYYETFTLFRKALLTGLATGAVFADQELKDPRVAMIFSMALLAFSLLTHQLVWPYGDGTTHNHDLNWLEVQALFSSTTIALSIIARMQSTMGMDEPMPVEDQNRMDLFAVVVCVPFVLRWLGMVLDATLGGGRLMPALDRAVRRVAAAAFSLLRSCYRMHCLPIKRAAGAAFSSMLNSAMGSSRRMLSSRTLRGVSAFALALSANGTYEKAAVAPKSDDNEETAAQAATRKYREALEKVRQRAEAREEVSVEFLRPLRRALVWDDGDCADEMEPPASSAAPAEAVGWSGGGGEAPVRPVALAIRTDSRPSGSGPAAGAVQKEREVNAFAPLPSRRSPITSTQPAPPQQQPRGAQFVVANPLHAGSAGGGAPGDAVPPGAPWDEAPPRTWCALA
jgi:hypothetical protein